MGEVGSGGKRERRLVGRETLKVYMWEEEKGKNWIEEKRMHE